MKLALLLVVLCARATWASALRHDWICVQKSDAKLKMFVTLYAVEGGKPRVCAVFAVSDDRDGLRSFGRCGPGTTSGDLHFADNPVCSYQIEVKKARITRHCDWSDETAPAPPKPVYDCEDVRIE